MTTHVFLQDQDVDLGIVVQSAEDYRILKATVKSTGREVAIKEYQKSLLHKEEDVTPIMREVERLVHLPPYVGLVPYVGAYMNTGSLHVIRDYVEGQVFSVLIPTNTFTTADIRRFGVQICDAVHFLHQNSLFNYNVKPDNIILKENGDLALCDYALLELRDSLQRRGKSSKGADIVIAPPEFKKGGYEKDKSDVYSIGLVLWMFATKKIPKVARFDLKLVVDEPLRTLLAAVLSKNPEERPTLMELRSSLAQ